MSEYGFLLAPDDVVGIGQVVPAAKQKVWSIDGRGLSTKLLSSGTKVFSSIRYANHGTMNPDPDGNPGSLLANK